jgi:hypothetical protein
VSIRRRHRRHPAPELLDGREMPDDLVTAIGDRGL